MKSVPITELNPPVPSKALDSTHPFRDVGDSLKVKSPLLE
jgi:hypothetical protein